MMTEAQIVGLILRTVQSLNVRFLVRGGMAADLAAVNEVPKERELVIEIDTLKMKIGDAATSYNALAYLPSGVVQSVTGDAVDNTDPQNPVITATSGGVQPGDGVSTLSNDAGYLAPGDAVSGLSNDAGYLVISDVAAKADSESPTFTGDVYAPSLTTDGYSVDALPPGVTGMRSYVTDALNPSFGTPLVGGGSVVVPAFYDGTSWVSG